MHKIKHIQIAWARAKKLVWIESWFVEKKMIANGMKAEIIEKTEKAVHVKTQFGTEEW